MRSMLKLGTLLALLASPMAAQAACSQLSVDGFEGFVDDAMSAIDDDDLVRHGAVFRAMQEQIPCLDERVPVEKWSEFLIGFSIVEYAMGREWKPALDAALRVNPSVPREFGPVEIRSYTSAVNLQPDDAYDLPTDAEFYVDGKQITKEPSLGKLHIVQRKKDGAWSSFLLLGQPWPEEWKAERAPEVSDSGDGPSLRASVFAQGGLVAGGQTLGNDNSPLIPEGNAAGALLGVGSFGDYAPSPFAGLFWDISAPLGLTGGLGNGMAVEAYAGPAGFAGPVAINVGAGMTTVGIEDVNGTRLVIIPQPRLGARYVQEITTDLDLDVGVGGGWVPPGWHGRLHAGVRGGSKVGWNAGLTLSANGASLEEPVGNGGVTAAASAIRVGLRGGLSFE